MTEPEQWAVELLSKILSSDTAQDAENTIQRAFEERERKLREAAIAQPSGDVVEAVADHNLEHLEMSEKLQDAEDEIRLLAKALHDAINSPKGVVPASAEAFYDPAAITAYEAVCGVAKMRDDLAEAEGRVKWVFPKSIADMPVKPGKSAYEYVECLILRKGEMLCRPWNCEHQVFDDEAQDDFFCECSEVTAYMDLTAIRALASDPLLDRQGKEGV